MTTEPADLKLELAAARPAEAHDDDSVRALREENAAFLRARDPAAFARVVERRARKERAVSMTKRASLVLAPALAFGLVALVTTRDTSDDDIAATKPASSSADIRVKGTGPLLIASLVKPDGPSRVDVGTRARAGDVVQLRIDQIPSGDAVVIVSIDGRGGVTLHHPLRAGERLGPQGLVPKSFELDDAPAFERFIAVVGSDVRVDDVVSAANTVAHGAAPTTTPLPLPASLTQRSLVVVKETTQ